MIVFSESSPQLEPSASADDLRKATEAARLTGCRIYHIPPDFSQCESAENALANVPTQEQETPAIWIGYIPEFIHYKAIYTAALAKGIRLLNSPEQHLNAQEFDHAYSYLTDLTPLSVIITSKEQCRDAVELLGLPVFVKGAVQSRKSRGWKACVAESLEELCLLTQHLLALENRSRGRVVVRQLVTLRHTRTSPEGFPFGRKYRIFLYQQQVMGFGYYWEGNDPLKSLTLAEEDTVLQIAFDAAKRVGTPYIAVDVGQTEDEQWVVIETGDAQFSGVSQTPILPLWNRLSQITH